MSLGYENPHNLSYDNSCGIKCYDGYCCNVECGGDCQSCNVAGSEGVCISDPDGTDPTNNCGSCSVCESGYCVGLPEDSSDVDSIYDYVNYMPGRTFKFEIDNDLRSFDYTGEELSYQITPNTSLRTSIAFNYRFISFKIGYSPKFLTQGVEDEKGKTKVFKIQTDLFFNHWMQSLEYSKVISVNPTVCIIFWEVLGCGVLICASILNDIIWNELPLY